MANGGGDLRLLAIALLAAVALVAVVAFFAVPAAAPVLASLNEGLTIRQAVPWGFGLTVALIVLFALVAGDSLFGELHTMLASFFVFFLILTLLIAWVF